MSTPTSFNLYHAPDNKGYRLIELPPELQSLLESANPPVLTVESSSPSAVLKSPSGTYSLRQKNTSNSVFLLSCRPLTTNLNVKDKDKDMDKERDSTSIIELAAISTIKETIELHPSPQHVGANTQDPVPAESKSKGKWHEKFGSSR